MRRRNVLCAVCQYAVLACVLGLEIAPAAQHAGDGERGSRIEIGEPVVIANTGDELPIWLEIAAAPDRASSLIACGMLLSPQRRARGFVFASADAGRTWRQTLDVADAPVVSEETCAIGPEGRAYSIMQPGDGRSARNARLRFYRSLDGGSTWEAPGESAFSDMATMTVDAGPGPRTGAVYVVGNGFHRDVQNRRHGAFNLFRAAAGQVALTGPVTEPPHPEYTLGASFPGGVRVDRGGRVYAIYHAARLDAAAEKLPPERYPRTIEVVRSDDGGRSWQRPVVIAPFDGWGLPDVPAIAIDRSHGPYRDRVYAAWSGRSGGRSRIHLSWSTDRARRWTVPRLVDDGIDSADGAGAVLPHLAVGHDGVLALSWFDRRASCWRVTMSFDGGRSFDASRAYTSCAAPGAALAAIDRTTPYLADRHWEVGLAVDAHGRFWPIWAERTSNGHRIMTVPIATTRRPSSGAATRH